MEKYRPEMLAMQAAAPDRETAAPPAPPPPVLSPDPLPAAEPAPAEGPPCAADGEGTGGLQVRAFTADGAFPVEGATVRVYARQTPQPALCYLLQTDRDGLTPTVRLPGIPLQDTQAPGRTEGERLYEVWTEKEGYYSVQHRQIAVYNDTVTRQPVRMIPLPDDRESAPPQIFTADRPDL